METVATVLSLFIAVIGLLAYYSSEDATTLFAATGFLGTAVLDGYHTVVTSSYFIAMYPSAPADLIGWSWFASRTFLAVLLWLSWFVWWRTQAEAPATDVDRRTVYGVAGSAVLACFALFAWVPIRSATYGPVPRPQEWVPALFFLLTFAGYLRKGDWRSNLFEHWLVLGLAVSFVVHAGYMAFSKQPYDAMFTAAHLLKCLSYLCVLIGVLCHLSRVYSDSVAQNELKILHAQLREQAIRDPLTGLYNRRHLDETLGRELVRAVRSGRPLSLVMVDVDHFKAVNDVHGHQAGDQVLQAVGQLLQRHSRGGDTIGRYGGEEFLLILPEMTAEKAHARAEQWRAGIAAMSFAHGAAVIRVTASFGVASCHLHGHTADALIAAADSALYTAKRAGRNQVRTMPSNSSVIFRIQ
jgi:diguanylate cyclase (GGDEF)-like protein